MANERYNGDVDGLVQQISDLIKRVDNLERGNRVGNTSIDRGVLAVRDGQIKAIHENGNPTVQIGNLDPNTGISGIAIRRSDLSLMVQMTSTGNPPTDEDLFFYDKEGNIILSDNWANGPGLGFPILAHFAIPTSSYSVPSLSTTSGSFAALWTVSGQNGHNGIIVLVLVQSDVGTTGEVRLRDPTTGLQIGTTLTVTSGFFNFAFLNGPVVPSIVPINSTFKFDVEARRTGGAGVVRVEVIFVYGAPQ